MRINRKIAALGGLLSGLLLASPNASAQDMPVMDWITPQIEADRMGQMLGVDRNGNKLDDDKPAGTKAAAGTRPANARPVSLAYTPSPALKAQTVQGYVTRLKAKNPAAAQAVATNFGPGKYDYGTIYRGLIQGTGLGENNAADALSAYMILGWMIANNVQDGKAITPAIGRGVRAQFAPKLAATPKLTAPGVPAQLGEEMKLLFVTVQGGWQAAIKENALPAYQEGVGAMFKNQYGMDMRLFKLTDQGFAKK
ncbi:hypothetical protein [Hymenobacter sp.]|uniref:hypothetical protein n=1 Tax=Hymenobacter sp. TaxID=1898978 RepID=UPI002869F76D|nr:hypothetical protein [Hymenobacter sp.]